MTTVSVHELQRRLARWSSRDLQLQPLTLGRVLTGEFPIVQGSPEAELLEKMLKRAERQNAMDRTPCGAIV